MVGFIKAFLLKKKKTQNKQNLDTTLMTAAGVNQKQLSCGQEKQNNELKSHKMLCVAEGDFRIDPFFKNYTATKAFLRFSVLYATITYNTSTFSHVLPLYQCSFAL